MLRQNVAMVLGGWSQLSSHGTDSSATDMSNMKTTKRYAVKRNIVKGPLGKVHIKGNTGIALEMVVEKDGCRPVREITPGGSFYLTTFLSVLDFTINNDSELHIVYIMIIINVL